MEHAIKVNFKLFLYNICSFQFIGLTSLFDCVISIYWIAIYIIIWSILIEWLCFLIMYYKDINNCVFSAFFFFLQDFKKMNCIHMFRQVIILFKRMWIFLVLWFVATPDIFTKSMIFCHFSFLTTIHLLFRWLHLINFSGFKCFKRF